MGYDRWRTIRVNPVLGMVAESRYAKSFDTANSEYNPIFFSEFECCGILFTLLAIVAGILGRPREIFPYGRRDVLHEGFAIPAPRPARA
jgi:hypothetical protein